MAQLDGKRIAIVTSNSGVEEAELASPRQAVIDAGGEAVLLAPEQGEIRTLVHDEEPGRTFTADRTVAGADPADFDGLILPGGTLNADKLRLDEDAIEFVDAFVAAGKPVASICHGPWALIESGWIKGKTLTSFPSLQTDVENAGAKWVDEEVHVDRSGGWTLVTSRDPGDLDAFDRELVAEFGGAA